MKSVYRLCPHFTSYNAESHTGSGYNLPPGVISSANTMNQPQRRTTRLSIDRSLTEQLGESPDTSHAPSASPGINTRAPAPCAECGLRINNIGEACHAMGYLYHNSCFVCCFCQRTLSGKVFYKDQDKIYCEEDYLYCGFQYTTEKCTFCGHIIAEKILQALGKAYHPGCFRCCICTKCLEEIPFAVDSQNLAYCIADYHLVHSPRCSACGQIITPEDGSNEVVRVIALERQFHVECYRCSDCKRMLGDEPENRCYPMNEGGHLGSDRSVLHLLCLHCHLARIGAVPATTSGTSNSRPNAMDGSPNRFYSPSSRTISSVTK